ncbi:hypothetical protein N7456_010003 [Penicillium angulare]|uniref:Uncharacterized protein n=1 Tax=Penicillium angulare TaxID=116970 RepID=A0A9W9K6N6_9EURO|nr:hypothetical protein N7456_010003 [Penicillium angulare]
MASCLPGTGVVSMTPDSQCPSKTISKRRNREKSYIFSTDQNARREIDHDGNSELSNFMNAAEMEVIEEEVIRNVDWRNISNISNIMVKGVGQKKHGKGKNLLSLVDSWQTEKEK